MVCPLGEGSVGLSWGVGGSSVGLSLWKRLFHSRVGRICVSNSREGASLSLCLGGPGLCIITLGSLHLSPGRGWGRRRVFASALWQRNLSVRLPGRSGRGGLPFSDSHCPLSPGQRSHLRARLRLGLSPPAASRSGLRRPEHGRPWRRLRALRLPRLPGRLGL